MADLEEYITKKYGIPPYFDESNMSDPNEHFVLSLDLMGMRGSMLRDLRRTANFLVKLVLAGTDALSGVSGVKLIPVIDGVFIYGPSRDPFLGAVKGVFARLAMACVSGKGPTQRFLVRGGIARGLVVEGAEISDWDCFHPKSYNGSNQRPHEIDSIIFGPAVSRAYQTAQQAPPFGCKVHESASETPQDPTGIAGYPLWHWWGTGKDPIAKDLAELLKNCISNYFDYCEDRSITTGYPREAIQRHRRLFEEYYIDISP